MSFSDRLMAKMATRQAALSAVGTNPPRPVLRNANSTVDAETNPAAPAIRSDEQSRTPRKRGSEQLPGDSTKGVRPKRTRGGDTSNTEGRPPRQDDPAPRVEDASARRRGAEVGDASSRKYSWLQKDFHLPSTSRGMVDLASELRNSAPPMTGLHLSNPRVGRYLGFGPLYPGSDPDTLRSMKMGPEDTTGSIGALLAQVCSACLLIYFSTFYPHAMSCFAGVLLCHPFEPPRHRQLVVRTENRGVREGCFREEQGASRFERCREGER